jgi:hypothetical protein
MGFPQDIRSLEGLNKLLDELLLEEEREREQQQDQDLLAVAEHAHRMTPRVEATLGNLIGQMHRSRPPLPEEPYARTAEIFRRDAIRTHMVKVAVRSHSPAELRMRLIRDGTIPDEPVIERLLRWEWLP